MYRFAFTGSKIAVCLSLGLTAAVALAQDEPSTPAPPSESPAPAAAVPEVPRPAAPAANPRDPQPYDKVITKEAKSKKGIFTVHQIRDRYYYEIPKSELDKEFLWNTQIARTTLGVGYGGQPVSDHVVRWELNNNRVLLREPKYDVVADPKSPVSLAVKAANNDTIIMAFPVAAFSKDGAPVIEVTRLFNTDVPEFSARQRLGASGVDTQRSFIERVTPYPENIEAESTFTFTRPAGGGGGAANPNPAAIANGTMRPGSATVVIHHSMVKLPEKPMHPRLFDERVGFFNSSQLDYSSDEHRAARVRYINRWRLEKRDPNAALSEPVKPIVYYIDPATPTKWVPWLKRGIESWQPAFEAAGFKNAIIAKEAPSAEKDPEFSPEDARYSVVRWLPSTTENALGPNLHDPRTGEILNADIQVYHNVMNLQRSWYFLQVGALDPRAQKLPLPDDLMGRLLEFVVAHEVGHTLGLEHNMKASAMYPQEKVHDREWVKTMGFAPSIMDYARFDYVAQPEDKLDVADLVPRIGPYDNWAISWGYKPIANVKTPEDEKATLNKWAREQDATPWFRFDTARTGGSDPGQLTEAIGDADAIKSTGAGIKNLQRVAKLLLSATTAKEGESYDDLAEMYGRMLAQWTLELNHVVAIVGGVNTQEKYVGQDGPLFLPVPKAHQEEAVKFLHENAFATPTWAIDPDILRRIEPTGVLGRIRTAQTTVLNNLLGAARFSRLVEQNALDGAAAYGPGEFLTAVRKGVWKELDGPQVKVDAYRRNLQRAYLDIIDAKLNPPTRVANIIAGVNNASGDEAPMYRAELRTLRDTIVAALPKASERETRAHLESARDQIARMLDPKFVTQTNGAATPVRTGFAGFDGFAGDMSLFLTEPDQLKSCWPDYIILP